MLGIQGENKNLKEETVLTKNGVAKNKEVIAEYDEALINENQERDIPLGKLEQLKHKLGLSEDSPDSSGIKTNLIDDNDVATFFDWKDSLNVFVTYFLIIMIIVSGTLAYFSFLEKEKEKELKIFDENIVQVKENIEREESLVEDGLELQSKMTILETLLDKHVHWTNLFEYLEKNALKNVYFQDIQGELDGEYNFSSVAKDSYFTASEQLKSFKEDEFTKSVDISNLSMGKGEDEEGGEDIKINFMLDVKVNPNIFYKTN